MASKREWAEQERRDRESSYLTRFLNELGKIETLAEAIALTKRPTPPGSTGRLRYTNLMMVLEAFRQTGTVPPYRVDRSVPLVPNGSVSSERVAYIALVERLYSSGQVGTEDVSYVSTAMQRGGLGVDDVLY